MEKTYINNVSNYIDENGHLPPTFMGLRLLHLCYEINEFEHFEKFVKAGSDINELDAIGKTILMRAVEEENPEVAKMLIRFGADLNAVDGQGKTCISYLRFRRDSLSIQGTLDLLKLLYDSGADFNHIGRFKNGSPQAHPLIYAIKDDYLESFIVAMIETVDNLNLNDKESGNGAFFETGENALMGAYLMGMTKVIQALLDKGINLNHAKDNGKTIFEVMQGHKDNVKNGIKNYELISEFIAKKEKEELSVEIKEAGVDVSNSSGAFKI